MKRKFTLFSSMIVITLLTLATVTPVSHTGGLFTSNTPGRSTIKRDNAHLRGIDVSHHQGYINWEKVSDSDIGFCFIKATEGRTFTDKRLMQNLQGCAQNNLPRGAYHFYIFGADPATQARNYISRVPKKSVNLPPVIDLEYDGRYNHALHLSRNKKRFIQEVRIIEKMLRNHYGRTPIFYTNPKFYNALIKGSFDNPIWMCDLKNDELHYLDSSRWHFWQYSHTARIPGISVAVDKNLYNGTRSDFDNKMLNKEPG